MDAEMIILCDGVVVPQQKKLTGVSRGWGYPADRGACGIVGYLGVDTEVVGIP